MTSPFLDDRTRHIARQEIARQMRTMRRLLAVQAVVIVLLATLLILQITGG